MKKSDFLHVDTSLLKLKVEWNVCTHGLPTLVARKLAVFHEEINGINWFLVCWCKFRKA